VGLTVALWLVGGGAVACGPGAEPTAGPPGPETSVAGAAAPTTAVPTAQVTATAMEEATGSPTPSPSPSPSPTPTPSPATATPTAITLPPVVGPEPSNRVAAFYYPWYRTVAHDGAWEHWGPGRFHPPLDIPSDYYPLLGAYSNVDPAVVAQHFAWLRQAGVGLIVSSWWGQRSIEEDAVWLLLDMGARYGIQVAFHMEPYGGRTANGLLNDVRYLYSTYGDHPAFYRTTAASRWSPDDRAKGLFFLWSSRFPDSESAPVEADYWREALDAIHALPDGGLVLADETGSAWVDGGHFDGLYSYALLEPSEGGYDWARGLPPGAWYVPGVNPGFSAVRNRYPEETYVPRRDGAAYEERWAAALGAGIEPSLVAVTTFNEWHEGTQIEPAAAGVSNGRGYTYEDYGALPPEGYLALTRQWVDRFRAVSWEEPVRVRIRLATTSDWTTLALVGGATWLRPALVSASGEALDARLEGAYLILAQPLARAEGGGRVEMVFDLLLSGLADGGTVVFEVERGHLGATRVEVSNYLGTEPVVVQTFEWGDISPGERNAATFQVPADALLE
jgi:glycoprotein endo-alpha-1,2-mannosidase